MLITSNELTHTYMSAYVGNERSHKSLGLQLVEKKFHIRLIKSLAKWLEGLIIRRIFAYLFICEPRAYKWAKWSDKRVATARLTQMIGSQRWTATTTNAQRTPCCQPALCTCMHIYMCACVCLRETLRCVVRLCHANEKVSNAINSVMLHG